MYHDFDILIDTITNNFHRFEIKKQIMGIDLVSELFQLRKEIENISDSKDFVLLVQRALTLTQDKHNSVVNLGILSSVHSWDTNSLPEYQKEYIEYISNLIPDDVYFFPLTYYHGEYKVYTDFWYKDILIPEDSVLVSIDGIPIHEYVKGLISYKTLKWDKSYHILYHEMFYLNQYTLEKEKGLYTFIGSNDNLIPVTINYNNQITLKKPFNDPLFQLNPDENYSTKLNDNIYYMRIKHLYGDTNFLSMLDIKYLLYDFNKIILDLRGSPGGLVRFIPRILSMIYTNEFTISETVGLSDTNNRIFKEFTSVKYLGQSKISVLNNLSLHIFKNSYITKPTKNNLNFRGKVYILLDDETFSAATTIQENALNWPNVITVGQPSAYEQGEAVGTYWVLKYLPESKIPYQLSTGLNLNNYKTIDDLFESSVEITVPLNWEQIKNRLNYPGYVYNPDFLLKQDPWIQAVIND